MAAAALCVSSLGVGALVRFEAAGPGLSTALRGRQSAGELADLTWTHGTVTGEEQAGRKVHWNGWKWN